MKKNILLLLMSLLFFKVADAEAQECYAEEVCCDNETNIYAKVFSGANFLESTKINGNKASYQTGYIISGAIGVGSCYGLSLEAEYAFRRNGIKNIDFFGEGSSNHGHFQSSSYMASLLWDLSSWGRLFWNIEPFIGWGIGYDFEQMHSSNSRVIFSQKWHHFSWQAMAGLAYPIFCNTEITLEYKFHQGGHFYSNSVGAGLVYKIAF